jgi:hypothetical protein
MKKQILTLLFTASLFAGENSTSEKLHNGLFLGLGSSYNSVKVDQHLSGLSVSNVFSGSSLVAFGQAGGEANPFHDTVSTFAPQAQMGYFHRFSDSHWFLGCRAAYQYLGVTLTENNLDSFQTGTYTTVSGSDVFTGHLVVGSSQTHVDHEIFALPFFGYFFNESSVYLGGGASLFGTEYDLYGVTGFARINGATSDIIGPPENFSNSKWIWGGIAQIGWIYPFASTWFLDLNYSYAATGKATMKDSSSFANTLVSGIVYTETGAAYLTTTQRITTQSLTVTINKLF